MQMHRASATATCPPLPVEQFSEDGYYRDAFRDRVPMPTMGTGDEVSGAECLAHASRGGFLTHGGMERAGHHTFVMHLFNLEFDSSDELHSPVKVALKPLLISARPMRGCLARFNTSHALPDHQG